MQHITSTWHSWVKIWYQQIAEYDKVLDSFIFQLTNNLGLYGGYPFGSVFSYPYSNWYSGNAYGNPWYTGGLNYQYAGGPFNNIYGGGLYNGLYGVPYNNLYGTYGYTGLNPYFGRVGFAAGPQSRWVWICSLQKRVSNQQTGCVDYGSTILWLDFKE